MTDLDKFVSLYESLGIICVVNQNEDGFWIELVAHDSYDDPTQTKDARLDGYLGFNSKVEFDVDGKFIKQGFWE